MMLSLIPIIFSALSLVVSSYALYRRGPQGLKGEQGEKGDTGPRGSKGDPGEKVEKIKPIEIYHPPQPYHSELDTRLAEIRQRLNERTGLMKSDPDAQSNQPDWRRRNAR